MDADIRKVSRLEQNEVGEVERAGFVGHSELCGFCPEGNRKHSQDFGAEE